MWIMTEEGFFSAVENNFNRKEVVVRARQRKDLENLLGFIDHDAFEVGPIQENKGSDYRYRLFMSKQCWAEYVEYSAMSINYTNFKDRIEKVDYSRALTYGEVWSVLYDLQINENKSKIGN